VRKPLVLIAILLCVSEASANGAITGQVVKSGLNSPAAFTFDPSGRIFYGELKRGRVHILNPVTGADTIFYTVPNIETAGGEQGLLGIARHPDYPNPAYVYLFVTRTINGVTTNQILRVTNVGGVGTSPKVIINTPAANFQNSGHIAFGPDKKLYAVAGDNAKAANAQSLNTLAGKYLRLNADGSIPTGNPISNSPIIAYGIRNSFGFAFDPQTGRLWDSQNGPACNDELNLVPRTTLTNFAWGPSQTCSTPPQPPLNTNQDGPNRVLPKFFWSTTVAPTGAAFCQACQLDSASNGKLFVGQYNDSRLRRFALNSTRTGFIGNATVYTAPGKILSLERAPDGRLYLSTPTAIYRLVLS